MIATFVEMQLKIENLKSVLPKPVYRSPKRREYVTDYHSQFHF